MILMKAISFFLVFLLLSSSLSEMKISQLTDPVFPDRDPSSRYLTNNKRLFKAYKDQPMVITLISKGAKTGQLYINKYKIELGPLIRNPNSIFDVNITEYIKSSDSNTFSIQNIQPKEATICL